MKRYEMTQSSILPAVKLHVQFLLVVFVRILIRLGTCVDIIPLLKFVYYVSMAKSYASILMRDALVHALWILAISVISSDSRPMSLSCDHNISIQDSEVG